MASRPRCETPGCGRPIPTGGEGHPQICPTCLACLEMHDKTIHKPDTRPVEMTEEWQVFPGGNGFCHVFYTRGAVFGFLAAEWQKFVLGWDARRDCRLTVEVRHVMRQKVAEPKVLAKKSKRVRPRS